MERKKCRGLVETHKKTRLGVSFGERYRHLEQSTPCSSRRSKSRFHSHPASAYWDRIEHVAVRLLWLVFVSLVQGPSGGIPQPLQTGKGLQVSI